MQNDQRRPCSSHMWTTSMIYASLVILIRQLQLTERERRKVINSIVLSNDDIDPVANAAQLSDEPYKQGWTPSKSMTVSLTELLLFNRLSRGKWERRKKNVHCFLFMPAGDPFSRLAWLASKLKRNVRIILCRWLIARCCFVTRGYYYCCWCSTFDHETKRLDRRRPGAFAPFIPFVDWLLSVGEHEMQLELFRTSRIGTARANPHLLSLENAERF